MTAMIAAVMCLVRLRLLDVPLERDEGEYAYAGQLMLHGIPPYKLAYNMKLPGTYAAYAAVMGVFGQTPRAIHLGLLLVNLATAVILYFLARRLFDDVTAAVAGSAFAVLSAGQGVLGPFAHATHFALLPALGGVLMLLPLFGDGGKDAAGVAAPRPGSGSLFASGALLGLAFVMKQHAILFVLFGVVAVIAGMTARRAPAARVAAACGWLLGGAVLPFAATCVVLSLVGVFGSFWFWTIDYARTYVSQVPAGMGLQILVDTLPNVAGRSWPLWLLAGVGLAAPLWDEAAVRRWRFTTLFALFSFLSICPGFYFREHYFVLLLPAVALLAAVGANACGRGAARGLLEPDSPGQERFARMIAVPLVALALGTTFWQERAFFFTLPANEVSRATYGANPFPEAVEIARKIAADSGPDDRVAVLGSEPEIYFYSRRLSATGHIYMYGLMESQPFARRMQEEAIREIETSAPRFVVLVNVPQSWLGRPDSDPTILTWSRAYLADHYEVAGVADIVGGGPTSYIWGKEALEYRPRSPATVYLFKRAS